MTREDISSGSRPTLPHPTPSNHTRILKISCKIHYSLTLLLGVKWPKGRYGLPQTINGCPASTDFTWKRGYRYHDTEDDGTENQHSDIFHLASNFTEDGIRHDFCIKDTDIGDNEYDNVLIFFNFA